MPVNLSRHAGLTPEAKAQLKEEELDHAVELIFAAQRNFWRVAEAPLGQRGLGPAHYRALAAIRRAEGQPVTKLRMRLGVKKQSLARVLVDLHSAGFIERIPGMTDRRNRLLALTPAGRAAEREASAALRERVKEVFLEVGPEAVRGAAAVMMALARREEPKKDGADEASSAK